MAGRLKKIDSISELPSALWPELQKWWKRRGTTAQAAELLAKHGYTTQTGNPTKWCATLFPEKQADAEQEFLDIALVKSLQALRYVDPTKKTASKDLTLLVSTVGRIVQAKYTAIRAENEDKKGVGTRLRALSEVDAGYLAIVREELEGDPELLNRMLEVNTKAKKQMEDQIRQDAALQGEVVN
jgi:hypothetical protein